MSKAPLVLAAVLILSSLAHAEKLRLSISSMRSACTVKREMGRAIWGCSVAGEEIP